MCRVLPMAVACVASLMVPLPSRVRWSLRAALAVPAVLCACSARAQQATLLADASVTTANPDTNYGTLSNLYVNGAQHIAAAI